MTRKLPLFTICLIALSLARCTKSEEDYRRAQRSTGGDLKLMPDNDPKFESEYVSDQSQVKLVAARTISYEPLDTFRGKSKSKGASDEPAVDEMPKKAATGAKAKASPPSGHAAGRPPSGGGFWTRVGMKALMGGAAPPAGAGAAPPGSKDEKPDAKGNKADDKKKPSKDKDADKEESKDDSGEKESKET
jgi:hypothetical protein